MTDAPVPIHERAAAWLAGAVAQRALPDAEAARLAQLERARPADLFGDGVQRPLVVALFGGTGVGKSSLLNRLAQATLARTGVERPTSHEVTLFLHAEVELARLPRDFPTERARIERHRDAARRNVLWIDTPDIDSAEPENRALALAWLPHIDLVVYVVSPERYRDDAGWRILMQRRARHGWLFALNRFDEGDPRQADDLTRILRDAGFAEPLVLRTIAAGPQMGRAADEFEQLERAIVQLHAEHGLRELERCGDLARLRELRDVLQGALARIGRREDWDRAAREWREIWSAAGRAILEGSTFAVDVLAAGLADAAPSRKPAAVLTSVAGRVISAVADHAAQPAAAPAPKPADNEPPKFGPSAAALWDDWAGSRAAAAAERLEVWLTRSGCHAGRAPERLAQALNDGARIVPDAVEDALRAAWARPGSALRRAARVGLYWLMRLLPLAALAWIAWHVVIGFQRGAAGLGPFFGSNFLIHSALLVAIAWGVPFALDRLLRPDRIALTRRALRSGLESGLTALGQHAAAALQHEAAAREELLNQGQLLVQQIDQAMTGSTPPADAFARRFIAAS